MGPNGASGSSDILAAELDELTRAFADRYVGLLSSVCDELKKDNPDRVQRREAQELLVNAATNVYDIASNANAHARVLDLVVVTTLISQVWIDDTRAEKVFGDRAPVLIRALRHGRLEAWALATQVFRPDQMDLLDYLLWNWRHENPGMIRVYSVRLSNFAIGRGLTANAEVLAAGGLFANVGQAGQALDEARLLAERLFYQLKRMPGLLRWQAEALKDSAFATPDVVQTLDAVHRLTEQVERLPENVATERRALLAAFDERLEQAGETMADVRKTAAEGKELVDAVTVAIASMKELLETADPLFARFDAWDRWSVDLPGARSFDVREYTAGLQELTVAVAKINEALESSGDLLASPDLDRRIQQVNEAADERVRKAVDQSQRLVHSFFWRAYIALGIVFAMAIVCLVVAFVLMRQLAARHARSAQCCASPDGRIADSNRKGGDQ